LETTCKKLDDAKIELAVTIPAADVDQAIQAAYDEANKGRIPGFRPGKAPRNILDKHFGGSGYFLVEATNELIRTSLPLAVDGEDLIPISEPDPGQVEPVQPATDYHYTLHFDVTPEFELSSYDPVQIELPDVAATDEEIQARINTMLAYYMEYAEVTGRASQNGDVLTLDMVVTHNGERVENMSGEELPYELGVDAMPAEFEQKFIGINPGDQVSVDFKLPYADGAEDAEEEDLHAEATLKKISIKQLPELTDAWVKEKLEYESVEHFRQLVADSIKNQREMALPELKEHRVADAIAERLEGEVTDAMAMSFAQDIYQNIFMNLQKQGATLDAFLASTGQTPEGFQEDVMTQSRLNARQALALDAWARHSKIIVNAEDIQAEFASSGVEDPEKLLAEWTTSGRLSEIRQGIRRMRAAQQLNESAVVTTELPGTASPASKKSKIAAKPAAAKSAKTGKTAKATTQAETSSSAAAVLPDVTQTTKAVVSGKPPRAVDKTSRGDGAKSSRKADAGAPKAAKPVAPKATARRTGGPKQV